MLLTTKALCCPHVSGNTSCQKARKPQSWDCHTKQSQENRENLSSTGCGGEDKLLQATEKSAGLQSKADLLPHNLLDPDGWRACPRNLRSSALNSSTVLPICRLSNTLDGKIHVLHALKGREKLKLRVTMLEKAKRILLPEQDLP